MELRIIIRNGECLVGYGVLIYLISKFDRLRAFLIHIFYNKISLPLNTLSNT